MIDINSETWRIVSDWADIQIAHHVAILQSQGQTERDADYSRGCLSALRDFQRLGEPKPDLSATLTG